jgi:hypothetical protein
MSRAFFIGSFFAAEWHSSAVVHTTARFEESHGGPTLLWVHSCS